jgi:hypothetical protein
MNYMQKFEQWYDSEYFGGLEKTPKLKSACLLAYGAREFDAVGGLEIDKCRMLLAWWVKCKEMTLKEFKELVKETEECLECTQSTQ